MLFKSTIFADLGSAGQTYLQSQQTPSLLNAKTDSEIMWTLADDKREIKKQKKNSPTGIMGVDVEYGQVSSATVVINGRGMSQALEGPRVHQGPVCRPSR